MNPTNIQVGYMYKSTRVGIREIKCLKIVNPPCVARIGVTNIVRWRSSDIDEVEVIM